MNIPNLPTGNIVDENGALTSVWLTFFQNLISTLQLNASDNGLVAPMQTAANIAVIQNNTMPNPSGGSPIYTCAYGTSVYNVTANSIMYSVNDGSGAPIFKTVTLV